MKLGKNHLISTYRGSFVNGAKSVPERGYKPLIPTTYTHRVNDPHHSVWQKTPLVQYTTSISKAATTTLDSMGSRLYTIQRKWERGWRQVHVGQ